MARADWRRWRKVSGRHHMYCAFHGKKVILGPGMPDGDIAYFRIGQEPNPSDISWQKIDQTTPAQDIVEAAEEPTGVLKKARRKGTKTWYDVINTQTGGAINTKALREEEADTLLAGAGADDDKEEDEE